MFNTIKSLIHNIQCKYRKYRNNKHIKYSYDIVPIIKTKNKKIEKKRYNRYKGKVYEYKKYRFNPLIIIAALAFFVSAGTLYKSCEQTEIGNRAYVVFDRISQNSFTNFSDEDKTVGIQGYIYIKNLGNTPSYQTIVYCNVSYSDTTFIPNFKNTKPLTGKFVLGNGEHIINVNIENTYISDNPQNGIFFYGYISYVDIFKEQRFTYFCLKGLKEYYKNYNYAN